MANVTYLECRNIGPTAMPEPCPAMARALASHAQRLGGVVRCISLRDPGALWRGARVSPDREHLGAGS